MTRAKEKVFLITVKGKESHFATDITSRHKNLIKDVSLLCPKCGGILIRRKGPYSDFYGCSNYKALGCAYKRVLKKHDAEGQKVDKTPPAASTKASEGIKVVPVKVKQKPQQNDEVVKPIEDVDDIRFDESDVVTPDEIKETKHIVEEAATPITSTPIVVEPITAEPVSADPIAADPITPDEVASDDEFDKELDSIVDEDIINKPSFIDPDFEEPIIEEPVINDEDIPDEVINEDDEDEEESDDSVTVVDDDFGWDDLEEDEETISKYSSDIDDGDLF